MISFVNYIDNDTFVCCKGSHESMIHQSSRHHIYWNSLKYTKTHYFIIGQININK